MLTAKQIFKKLKVPRDVEYLAFLFEEASELDDLMQEAAYQAITEEVEKVLDLQDVIGASKLSSVLLQRLIVKRYPTDAVIFAFLRNVSINRG